MTLMEFWERDREHFDAVLLDLDGTLLLGSQPLPGAVAWLRRLREERAALFFLTNNCSDVPEQIALRLTRAGIPADSSEIVCATAPLLRELERRNWRELHFFVIGTPAFAERNGLRFQTDPERIGECDGILFLGGIHDWRVDFQAAFNELLRRPELPVVIPNPDIFNPLPGGKISFCPFGQFDLVVHHLERRGIRIAPLHTGKPFPAIYDEVMTMLPGISRERVLAVGDSLSSDVEGANRAGMVSALLLTGLTAPEEAAAVSGLRRPSRLFSAIGKA